MKLRAATAGTLKLGVKLADKAVEDAAETVRAEAERESDGAVKLEIRPGAEGGATLVAVSKRAAELEFGTGARRPPLGRKHGLDSPEVTGGTAEIAGARRAVNLSQA